MASLVSYTRGKITGIDLSANAFWRIELGGGVIGTTPALCLNLRYPPGAEHNVIALLSVPVNSVQNLKAEEAVGFLRRIASVALETGDLEKDKERITEAFTMIKNIPKQPSKSLIDADIEMGKELVAAYWKLRSWLYEKPEEDLYIKTDDSELKGFA